MNTVQIEGDRTAVVPNIYCIGRNYADHAKELNNPVPVGEPVVFLKSTSSLRGLMSETSIAFADDTFHHEIEIVLRIGKTIPMGEAVTWTAVHAVGLGIDLTRRDTQAKLKEKGLPWTTAKSFAGSAIVAPLISVDQLAGQTQFEFSLKIAGQLKQTGNTDHMIFNIPHILTWLATFNTLQEGDLIFTGTPAGVGPIRKGEAFTLALRSPQRIWHGIL